MDAEALIAESKVMLGKLRRLLAGSDLPARSGAMIAQRSGTPSQAWMKKT
jgi:hypothetical protein